MYQTEKKTGKTAIVRGVGDVGSAIAWALFKSGYHIVCHENRQPRTIRRRMAFCDALWQGESVLDGVVARKCNSLTEVTQVLGQKDGIVIYTGAFSALVDMVKPDLLVDGRIQKFGSVEAIKTLAEMTVGIGPGFVAGVHVDVVIESCWGDTLGDIILEGSATAPVPVPPRLNGIGWERFVCSPEAGLFETARDIGDFVTKGDVVGQLDGDDVYASISGHLRGLLKSGLSVKENEKLCEIDPRGQRARFEGLAERPFAIAQGVIKAVSAPQKQNKISEKYAKTTGWETSCS